jgi:hypothetical protein
MVMSNRLITITGQFTRRVGGSEGTNTGSGPDDHYLGGLDESRNRIADLQAHLANGICSDDGCDVLAPDGETHLSQQSVNRDLGDTPDKLIPSADSAEVFAALAYCTSARSYMKELVQFGLGNPVMATRCLYRAELLFIDPLFYRRVAYTKNLCGVASRKQRHSVHGDSRELLLRCLAGTVNDFRQVRSTSPLRAPPARRWAPEAARFSS